jgi:dipeptidyl-peptidase 4
VPAALAADHQRTSSCCGRLRGDAIGDTEWSAGRPARGVCSVSRDYRDVTLRVADAATGAVRTVLRGARRAVLRVERRRPRRAELARAARPRRGVWYSQRDGWGHLYLYDLRTGSAEEPHHVGRPGMVVDVLHVDERGGWVYFTAAGRERAATRTTATCTVCG